MVLLLILLAIPCVAMFILLRFFRPTNICIMLGVLGVSFAPIKIVVDYIRYAGHQSMALHILRDISLAGVAFGIWMIGLIYEEANRPKPLRKRYYVEIFLFLVMAAIIVFFEFFSLWS